MGCLPSGRGGGRGQAAVFGYGPDTECPPCPRPGSRPWPRRPLNHQLGCEDIWVRRGCFAPRSSTVASPVVNRPRGTGWCEGIWSELWFRGFTVVASQAVEPSLGCEDIWILLGALSSPVLHRVASLVVNRHGRHDGARITVASSGLFVGSRPRPRRPLNHHWGARIFGFAGVALLPGRPPWPRRW